MLVMQEPIRVGVVGFGLAGKFFHAAVVSASPGLELACVVERSGEDAAKAWPGVKVARSVEELLRDTGIQLVVIATPSHSPSADRTARVVGEPLMNWRFAPALVKVRFSTN